MNELMTLGQAFPDWTLPFRKNTEYTIGVLSGEGVGPEVIEESLRVLDSAAKTASTRFKITMGGEIGLQAKQKMGHSLTPKVISFVDSIFTAGGAVLCGAGGGRFVYELRSRFDLFCKITPILPLAALRDTGVVRKEALKDVNILMVRENSGGIYFGQWDEKRDENGLAASHFFEYREEQVERILRVAIELADRRRGHITLVLKPGAIPSISRLWTTVLNDLVGGLNLSCEILEVDNAAFQLINRGRTFDVVVSPNLFGDILADGGGLLLGSRGMCFSGNFASDGRAVYQTGHGAALDLAGQDQANPIGQIHSLCMLLRVSFGLKSLAECIETAVERTLNEGWRTPDISTPGCKIVGTRELGCRICRAIEGHP